MNILEQLATTTDNSISGMIAARRESAPEHEELDRTLVR
jgi:hypothetical protein